MTFQLVPRSAIFGPDAIPDYETGAPRPKLRREDTITAHYTGTSSNWSDTGDTFDEIRAIQRYAASAGRYGTGWEYGYVIHQDDDDLVHEYAGDYVAYHSSGNNHVAVGVLFLNAIQDPLTDRQIDKFRWLKARLIDQGVLVADANVVPHRHMPGANTDCPGQLIMNQLEQLREPWKEPDMPLTDTDLDRIAERVWTHQIETQQDGPRPAAWLLDRCQSIVRSYLGAVSSTDTKPPAPTLLQRVWNKVDDL